MKELSELTEYDVGDLPSTRRTRGKAAKTYFNECLENDEEVLREYAEGHSDLEDSDEEVDDVECGDDDDEDDDEDDEDDEDEDDGFIVKDTVELLTDDDDESVHQDVDALCVDLEAVAIDDASVLDRREEGEGVLAALPVEQPLAL